MKHKFASFLSLLLWVGFAAAQAPITAPQVTTSRLGFPIYTLNAAPVPGASLSIIGVSGQQTYYYWASANYNIGSVVSFLGSVSNAPNTLSGSNYVSISPWLYPASVTSVDILRTTSVLAPTGVCNCAVATGLTSGAALDQANALSSYTVTSFSIAGYRLWLTNEITGVGASHLLLRNDAGALIADLSTASGGGTVTGGGTTGFLPEFTGASALGNSPIQDASGALQSTEGFIVGNIAGVGLQAVRQPVSCSGGASPSFDYNVNTIRCQAESISLNVPAASTGTEASIFGFASTTATLSATPAIAGVYGVNLNGGGGSANWQAGTVGFASDTGSSGTNANMLGVFGLASQGGSGQTATILAGVGGQATQSSTTNGPFGAALLAYSPNIVVGNFLHNYGLYIQDQTVGGGADPWGIFETGTAKNQLSGIVNGLAGFQQNGNSLGDNCGTTSTCGNTAAPLVRIVYGSAPLVSGTPSVVTVTGISPAFTSTTSYACSADNQTTAANNVKIVNTSTSSITITGPTTVSDVISYVCVGT